MGEGECESPTGEQPKKSRHRKKHLYNTILQQMEFYFSDSNLTKDRFLSQLLSENQYISIETFFKFNKIRKLNCSVEDLQKAIRKSDLIQVSEDGLKISRKTPVKLKENVDLCTIYVENIQADATHDSLSQIFSDFGHVVYVSIPKYKHNKANKGFAFIEYETEEEANSALSFFESIGCRISSEKTPEELQSIVTFEGTDSNISENNTNEENQEELLLIQKKRKYDGEEVADMKKIKTEDSSTSQDETKEKNFESLDEKDRKRKISTDEITEKKKLKLDVDVSTSGDQTDSTDKPESKKKKNKKEKRKNYIKDLGMQVLPKKEWKKLRNRYLELQRKKMKEFKQYLYKQKFSQKSQDKTKSHHEGKDDDKNEPDEVMEHVEKLSFLPGVIVKLTLPEPCMDVKKLKNEIKIVSAEVQYVDIPLPAGSEEVFIRFGTNIAAKDFCEREFPGEKTIIEGEEEKTYWEKIKNDRTVKFQKLAKKLRGREKLMKRAEKESAKHLRFDESDL